MWDVFVYLVGGCVGWWVGVAGDCVVGRVVGVVASPMLPGHGRNRVEQPGWECSPVCVYMWAGGIRGASKLLQNVRTTLPTRERWQRVGPSMDEAFTTRWIPTGWLDNEPMNGPASCRAVWERRIACPHTARSTGVTATDPPMYANRDAHFIEIKVIENKSLRLTDCDESLWE